MCMASPIRLASLLVLTCCVAVAASVGALFGWSGELRNSRVQVATKQTTPTATDHDLEEQLNQLRFVRPEFRVDGLLRLAAAIKATDEKAARELIDEAFTAIPTVTAPIRMSVIAMGADAVEGLLGPAQALGLDRLSFETRAIKLLSDIDLVDAHRRFVLIHPDTSSEDCAYPGVVDWQGYDDTAGHLLSKGPTPDASDQLWEHLIHTMRNPGQVRPMAKLVNAVAARSATSPRERAMQFVVALNAVYGSDRSFSAATWVDINAVRLISFGIRHEEAAVLPSLILPALREYVVRHAQSARCEDSVGSARTVRPRDAQRLTQVLCRDLPKCTLAVSEQSLRPAKVLPGINLKGSVFWRTPESAQLLRRIRQLRFGPSIGRLQAKPPERIRTSHEWHAEYEEATAAVAGWNGLNEDSRRVFIAQKLILLRALLSLAPDDRRRAQAVSELGQVLTLAEQDALSASEWLFFARDIVEIAGRADATAAFTVASGFVANHPALRMYRSLQDYVSRRSGAKSATDARPSFNDYGRQ